MSISDDAKNIRNIFDEVKNSMKELEDQDFFKSSVEGLEELASIQKTFFEDQQKGLMDKSKMSASELDQLQKKLNLQKENLSSLSNSIDTQQKSLSLEIQSNQQKLKGIDFSMKDLQNRINAGKIKKKDQGAANAAMNEYKSQALELNKTLEGQVSLQKQNVIALKAAKDNSGDLEKNIGKASKQKGVGETLKNFGDATDKINTGFDDLLNPVQLFIKFLTFGFSTVKEYDERLGKTAKSMNLTYDAADKSNKAMAKFANESNEAFVNSKHLNEQVTSINKTLGTSVVFEELGSSLQNDVKLMGQLQQAAGLTVDETANIMKYSMGTGQEAGKVTKELMASYKIQGLKSGLVLNEKEAMKAIGKTSKATQISYGGNAKELGKALSAAKGLGVELSKVEGISGDLLQFEKSIESELEAELLTGKNLNLEKARSAALNNDLATVAEEIANQVGSAADFGKMNRIQQEAMAAAVGMTRQELAGALLEQESLKAISAESIEDAQAQYNLAKENNTLKEFEKELGNEALANQLQQANIAEIKAAKEEEMADVIIESLPAMQTMAETMSAVMDTIIGIVDALGGAKVLMVAMGVIMTAKLVKGSMDFALGFQKSWQGAAKLLGFIKNTEKAEKALSTVKKANAATDKSGGIASIVKGAWTSLGSIPFIGPLLAGAAIGAGIALLASSFADDMVSPGGSGGGYGSRTLMGPEGAIQLNNKDTVIAGTNLFGDDTVSEPGKSTEMSGKGSIQIEGQNDAVVSAISSLASRMDSLASRPIDVGIDGTKVIEATVGSNPNTQGDETAKNSYKVQ